LVRALLQADIEEEHAQAALDKLSAKTTIL
jgi:hypothetical protein